MKLIIVALTVTLMLMSSVAFADGKQIYTDKCASCHAGDGSGNVPRGRTLKVPNLRGADVQSKSDAQLIKGILEARRHPNFSKMSKEDIQNVVAFMRSFVPVQSR